jgi:competence protein ComEC
MLIFGSFLLGAALFSLFGFFPGTSLLLGLSAAIYSTGKKKYLLVPLMLLGVAYAFLRYSPPVESLDLRDRELRLVGRFVPKAEAPAENPLEVFRVETAFDGETDEEIEGLNEKEVGIFSDVGADPEEEYEVLLKTGKERTRLNPGASGSGRLYGSVASIGEIGKARFSVAHFFGEKRALLGDYLLGRFARDSAGLIAAVTTGETSLVTAEVKEDFKATGLAHLLSISGTHFGLFSVMMFGTFVWLIRRLPYGLLQRLTIYLTPSQAAALLCLPLMVFYLGLSGAAPPAVRSFVMITLFLAGLLLGRKGAWLNSLFFAAFVLVLWDPGVLLSLSFQLSFTAVLFIGFAAEKKENAEEEGNRMFRYAKKTVFLALIASIGTAPLVAYYFHYLSVISPFANLIASPLIGSLLVLLSLLSSFSFLMTGHYLFAPLASVLADLSVALVRLMAKIPFAAVKLAAFPPALFIFFYAGFIPYLALGRRKTLLLLPFIPLFAYALLHALEKRELTATFLDVGQGDSAVVEFPGGKVVVIDAGRTGKETASFLAYEGVRTIDAVVLTHVHPDHSGGLGHLLETFRVKEIWDNGRIVYPEEDAGPLRRKLSRGDVIETEGGTITVLHPYPEFYSSGGSEYGEENDSSLVLRIAGRKSSFLFGGDVEEEAEEDISHLGRWCRADVLKIPHHGSRTSAHEAFLSAVSPGIAVVSVGRENSFGHPAPEVLERLSGMKVFRTDRDGAVRITETDSGLTVKTFRDFALQTATGPKTEWQNIERLFSTW